jgi:hypothetical protein
LEEENQNIINKLKTYKKEELIRDTIIGLEKNAY